MDRKLNNYWVGFGAVVTIMLGGFWFIQTKLTSPRPQDPTAAESLSDQYPRKASIRLWQDPLECIIKNKSSENTKDSSISEKDIFGDIESIFKEKDGTSSEEKNCTIPSKVLLLGVMIPGKHYTDRAERRIRCRKAIIDGLAESNYIPLDSERMGYFSFSPYRKPNHKQNDPPTIIKTANSKTNPSLDSENPPTDNIRVPFEWFQKIPSSDPLVVKDKHNSSASSNSPPIYEYVLVTWIDEDEDHFEKYPLKNLRLMRNYIDKGRKSFCESNSQKEGCIDFDFFVIGPWSSSTLQTIRAEGNDKNFGLGSSEESKELEELKQLKPNLPDITFYNTSATFQKEDAGTLRYQLPGEKMEELGDKHRFRIRHIVSSDEMLGKALLRELNLRRKFTSQNKIILIGEHDTKYGRELLNILGDEGEKTYQIKRYTYLRGLDGSTAQQEEKQPQTTTEKGPTVRQLLIPIKTGNLPEGNNQYDYIVRLATKIEEEDQKPFAIGVLGSDVYDKLILLQELKKHFPDTLFFTTDMEAAYLNARELTGTRNLIVASSHGLMLNSRYQKMTSPFRSNYQTSMFHGVQAILNRRVDTGLLLNQSPPRVFEIGWRKAIDLSICEDDQQLALAKKIHPPVRPNVPHWERWQERQGIFDSLLLLGAFFLEVCQYLILLIGLGFALTLSAGGHKQYFRIVSGEWIGLFKKSNSSPKVTMSWKQRVFVALRQFFIVAAIFAFVVFVIVECHFNPQLGSEPFYILEGVSVWPTVFIHAITAFIMSGIIVKVYSRITKTDTEIFKEIGKKINLDLPSKDDGDKSQGGKKGWRNFLRCLMFWKSGSKHVANMKKFYHWFRWIVLSDDNSESIIKKNEKRTPTGQGQKKSKATKTAEELPPNNKPENIYGYNRLGEFWILHTKTLQERKFFIAFVTLLIFFIFIPNMAMISSWTSYRGNVVFYFDILVWGLSCFGLILTSVMILVDGLSCHRFIKYISQLPIQDPDPKKAKDKKDYIEERDFQLLKFKLISIWTKENHLLLAVPMILLMLLVLAKIPLFDTFGSGYWFQLLFVITIFILSFFPVARIRLTANRMRRDCIDHLEETLLNLQKNLINGFPQEKEKTKESIEVMQTTMRSIREYDEGIFSAYLWHPILPIVVILGSGSLLTPFLFEMFMR